MSIHDYHEAVLLNEAVSFLITDPSGVYVDGTIGGGGHSEKILEKISKKGIVIGIDRDREAVAYSKDRFKKDVSQIQIYQGAFEALDQIVQNAGIEKINGLLLDLGISSHQIDEPSRGFSYLKEGPLDMRMDLQGKMTAYDVVHTYSEASLADLFFYYGEERRARQIARKIVIWRDKERLDSTTDLANLIRGMSSGRFVNKTLSRIFQALRIEVNNELSQLKTALKKGDDVLKLGGRVVVIAYHSLEDRLVKRFFRGEFLSFLRQDMIEPVESRRFRALHKKVIRPSTDEIARNPRARSARLRAAEKIR
ncbi:16S rRNA (cytosine(1402)-N(4))-methyltransferase RsmH [bacterium]|nr:16S rRNA (cytosine(1402)-N(4))-methyltransferase RsmH [bacterium]